MQVYCFPRPQVAEQAILIKSIGSTENELSDVMISMLDHEKLVICRDTVKRASKLGFSGNVFTS